MSKRYSIAIFLKYTQDFLSLKESIGIHITERQAISHSIAKMFSSAAWTKIRMDRDKYA